MSKTTTANLPDLRAAVLPLVGGGPGQVTQAELARRTGVVRPSISAWLAGARGLPFEKQAALCEAAGLRVRVTVSPKHKRPSAG